MFYYGYIKIDAYVIFMKHLDEKHTSHIKYQVYVQYRFSNSSITF